MGSGRSKKKEVDTMKCVLLVLMVVGSLAVVGLSQAQEKVTLKVLTQWAGKDLEQLSELFSIYTAKTGVEVVPMSAGEKEFRMTIPLSFRAGKTPADLFFVPWIELLHRFAREGHLEPVGDLIDPEMFPPSFIDLVSVDGVIYAVPLRIGLKPGFAYKKSFFEKHGLVPPRSYWEFKALLRDISKIPGIEAAIASGDGDGWPLTDVTEGFIMGLGGPDMFKAIIEGEKNFTDPDVRGIMEEIRSLIADGYFGPLDEWRAQVIKLWDEKYGIFWTHVLPAISPFAEHPEEIGLFTFPGTKGLTAAFNFVFIPKYTEKKEAAEDFLRWLGTKEAQTEFARIRGELAARLDVPLEVYSPVLRWEAGLLAKYELLPDMDDIIGGEFLEAFRDQLKLLWTRPEELDDVLEYIASKAPAATKK